MLTGRCLEPVYLLEVECRRVAGFDGLGLFMMKESDFGFLRYSLVF